MPQTSTLDNRSEDTPVPVAQPSKLISLTDESNPYNYKVLQNQLLLSLIRVFGPVAPKRAGEILSSMREKGFLNVQKLTTLYVFDLEKVITAHDLMEQLDMPEGTVYRILRSLEKQEIICKITKIPRKYGKAGPKSTLYGVLEYDDVHLQNCLLRHQKRSQSGFQVSIKLQQLMIDDYFTPRKEKEITRVRMIRFLKENCDNKGYHWGDLAKNVAQGLQKRGYKVWM
jgi:hypothetical protein